MLVRCSGEISRAGKRVCFRKVEYPPPNVFEFYAGSLLAKMEPILVSILYGLFSPGFIVGRL